MREQFSRYVGPVIDELLGLRCTSFGYQYGEIVGEHRIPAADGNDTQYKFLMGRLDTKAFGLKKTSRIKAFVFKFSLMEKQTAKLVSITISCGF